jgi:hypothetical protein
VITKVLFSAAVAVGAAAAMATPAGADPDAFGTLGCGCEPTISQDEAVARDLIDQGIQSGLVSLQGFPASGTAAPLRGAARDRLSR